MSRIPEGKVLNRPTDLGRQVGENMARMVEPSVEEMRGLGIPDLRCNSCAFRRGTIPNGCESTIMDALKCGMEGVRFSCHEDPTGESYCHGWVAVRNALKGGTLECPWPFSDEVGERGEETL